MIQDMERHGINHQEQGNNQETTRTRNSWRPVDDVDSNQERQFELDNRT